MKKIYTNLKGCLPYKNLQILILIFLFTPFVIFGQINLDFDTNTSAFINAVKKDKLDVLEKLVKENSEQLKEIYQNRSLLFFAKSKKMIDFLIKNGLDVNHVDASNNTALYYAQSLEIASALVENGADMEIKSADYQAETPILVFMALPKSNEMVKYMVEKGANIFAKSAQKNGLLHKIGQSFHTIDEKLIDLLIQKGLNINEENQQNETPIFSAIAYQNIEKIKIFLKKGASLKNNMAYNPIFQANTEVLKILIESNKFDFNLKNQDDELFWLFLLATDYYGHNDLLEIVNLMIEKGINIKVKTKEGTTPLILAFSRKKLPTKTIHLLLDKKADVKGTDKNGANLLLLALKYPDISLDIVKKLVEKGVDINTTNKLGSTPFSLALSQNNTEIIDYLIKKKININPKNNQNKTALHYVKSPKMADFFLKKGFDINAKSKDGNTPLMIALIDNNQDLAKFFIENNADVQVQNISGNTALHLVTTVETATLLLNKKANINLKNVQGNTPLHFADNVEIAKLFYEKGADINANNNDRNTPLLMSLIEQQPQMAKFLVEKGAKDTENNFGMSATKLAKQNNEEQIYFMLQGEKTYQIYLKTLKLWEGIYANDINQVKDAMAKGADTTLINIKEKNAIEMLKDNYYKNYADFLVGKNTYSTFVQPQKMILPFDVQFLKNTPYIITKNYGLLTLIDIKTGKVVKEFSNYISTRQEIELSNDKKYLVVNDKKWNINTGKSFRNYQEVITEFQEDLQQEPEFDAIAVHKKYAVNLNSVNEMMPGYEIAVYDYVTKKIMFEIKQTEGYIQQYYFSGQGNYLVIKDQKKITLWDIKTQKEVFNVPQDDIISADIAVSQDEKYIAINSLENDKQKVDVYEISTKKLLKTFAFFDNKIENVTHLSFSKNNEYVVLARRNQFIELWNWQNAQLNQSFPNKNFYENPLLALSDDGQKIAIRQDNLILELYDIKSKKLLNTIYNAIGDMKGISYSDNLEYFIYNNYKTDITLQHITDGKNIIIPSKSGQEYTSSRPIFSPNMTEVLLFPNTNSAELWNIERRTKIRVYPNMIKGFEDKVKFSDDGKYILANNSNTILSLWDVNKSEPVATLNPYTTYGATISNVEMSGDAKTILIGLYLDEPKEGKKLLIWKPLTKTEENLSFGFKDVPHLINGITISKQDKYMFISGNFPQEVRKKQQFDEEDISFKPISQLWDFKTQKLLYNISMNENIISSFFTTDQKTLMIVSNNSIKLFETSSGQEIKTIELNERVESATFIPIKKQMVLKSITGLLKVIDIETEKEVLNIYQNEVKKSLFFVTNEGFYMPVNYDIESEEQKVTYFAHQQKSIESPFQFVNGTNIFTNEQFELQFNQPHQVLEKMVVKNQTLINSYKMIYEERLGNIGFKTTDFDKIRFFNAPEIKLKNINAPFITTKEKKYSLEIEAFDKNYNLHSLHVVLNDKILFTSKGKKLTNNKVNEFLKLDLDKGKNKIEIWVYNQKGIKSLVEIVEIELL
ncbi:MAG: hypothetical protein EAZ85_08290 [Bacteroidetes bacterium]|nr:MAG: hypothetical protein EAZ85_08290 [Bacteroidota bacterium]TAG89198.1 MAG: hypothetical protein EAZ20_06945 [Bacteroidota bacterium]